MHLFLQNVLDRERNEVSTFVLALKKTFSLLGGVYAPLFFCAACLMGISLPFFMWKGGAVIDALLGARGVGILTSELTQGMWVMVCMLALFLVASFLITRLEGKMRDVFMHLAYIAEVITLFVLSLGVIKIFLLNACIFLLWRMFPETRVRMFFTGAFFLCLVWIFFALAADVALRVSTIGDMVSVLGLCTLFFLAITRPLFRAA